MALEPEPAVNGDAEMSANTEMPVNDQDVKTMNIVVLGGSYGGVSIAHYVLKHVIPVLPLDKPHKVILVSTASQAMCRPACPRALISDQFFDQSQLFVDIEKQFLRYESEHFRFVHGTATSLDHENRNVVVKLAKGDIETIEYHALVVATGASTPSSLLGLNADVDELKAGWKKLREALPGATSIVIAGGGPAGVETAGELGEYLNGRAKFMSSELENPRVSITVVTSGSRLLPALRPGLAMKAEGYLAKVGVTVKKNTKVKSVGTDDKLADHYVERTTVHFDNGDSLDADIFINATGIRPNTDFVDKSLLSSDARVETDPSTLRVDNAGPHVYAIGDASSYARPAIHILIEAVPVLGANIKRDLLIAAGKDEHLVGPEKRFQEDTRETQMVPIGKGAGVGSAKGHVVPSTMVWAVKGRDYWLWTTKNLWNGKQWTKST